MRYTASMDLKKHITTVEDFPKPGIIFRDISPLLRDQFRSTIAAMSRLFEAQEWDQIDVIGGIESRGFILGGALALLHNKGFVKIRKQGKLPGKLHQQPYSLEYGKEVLEMQPGTGRILIIDDVLATGGTLDAAGTLASNAGYTVQGFGVLINLESLNEFHWRRKTARAAISYD